MPKVKSKAQWRKFGHMMSTGEMSRAEFDKRVHGVNMHALPERKGKKRMGKGKLGTGSRFRQLKNKSAAKGHSNRRSRLRRQGMSKTERDVYHALKGK